MAIKLLSGQTITGNITLSGDITAATFNSFAINSTGTNNVANEIVRTQGDGYVNFSFINSSSGNHAGSITRITASDDAYLRYVTPAQFRTGVTDGFYAPSSTVSGVTSVATGNGLTGGTIISTGTLSMSGSYTGNFSITSGSTVLSLNRTGGATALVELKVGGTVEGYLGANATKSLIVFNETPAERFSVSNGGNGIFTGTLNSGSITSTGQIICSTDTTTPSIGSAVFYKASEGAVVSGYQVILESGGIGARETALTISDSQNVGIGVAPASTRRLLIKGRGTSATTAAFQVNNGDNADIFVLKDDFSATFEGSITVNGISSTLKTGNSGTFATNDANDYPRISTASANIQLGLFRTSTGTGGVYIGGFSGGFEVRNGSSLAPIFNVNQSGTVTLTGDKTINTNSSLRLNAGGGTLFLDSTTNIILRTGGTSPALTLSSSQNVTLNSATALDFQVADFAQIKFRESGAITIDSDNNQDNRNFSIKDGSGTNLLLVLDTGDVTATGDVIAFSDKKLKKNIKTLDGSKVYKMRGVSFDRIDTDKASSGVIAQEMQEVAPELVNKSQDGTLGVAYGNISGYLIEAIKEQQKQIKDLQAQIKNISNTN